MTANDTVACIGAGHAGVHLADSLRTEGFTGPIVLIDAQDVLPYQRPPLSKEFITGTEPAPLPLKGSTWYDAHGVDLRTGAHALSIDRERKRVLLDDGGSVDWTHLVLAPGAAARTLEVPGSDLAGIHTLRTLADAKALRRCVGRARHVVVVGAGFIGLEFASAACSTGAAVTVVEAGGRALSRAVSPLASDTLVARLEAVGVRFVFDTSVLAIEGPDRARRVLTSAGNFDADLVVVGIGVIPRADLARGTGLDVGDGIVVDAELRTSDPNISAVGDVAAMFAGDTRRRTECVQNASDQARFVARRIAGAESGCYAGVPRFWSHQGSTRLQIVGLWTDADEVEVVGDPSGAFSVRHLRAGSLIAVESFNQPKEHLLARRTLESQLKLI